MRPLVVLLVCLYDESKRQPVEVTSVRELRDKAARLCGTQANDTWPKLYVFQDVGGAPRGTSERVKLEDEDSFIVLRAMPDGARTVYVFPEGHGGSGIGVSPPMDARPSSLAGSTGKRSASSARSEFASAVRRRYQEEGLEPIVCTLCGTGEGIKAFASAHLVPFDADGDDFLRCGIGNRSDGRNGVPMCPDCHETFDDGKWGFDEVEVSPEDDHIRLRVFVTEGLQCFGKEWAQRHGEYINVPNGFRWPTVDVWKASWAHNYAKQQKARHANNKKKCQLCQKNYTTMKGYMEHNCKPRVGARPIVPSPCRHWPLRKDLQRGGAAAAGPPLLASLSSPGTPQTRNAGGVAAMQEEEPRTPSTGGCGGRGRRGNGRRGGSKGRH
jgi:hypothetical protein